MFSLSLETKTTPHNYDPTMKWDVIIIGGGPAGLNAGLYAKRKGLHVAIITKDIGGQLHNTTLVDNFLGFESINGPDLSNQFLNHVKSLDVPIFTNFTVESIQRHEMDFVISMSDGSSMTSKTVLITTGGSPRKLEVPGEHEFANKGVSYCTTCDAPFFKGKHVIVAGGGNSAVEAVIDLSKWASKITLVHRSQFRADDILLKKLDTIQNLTVLLNTQILRIDGSTFMDKITVLDKASSKHYDILADGIFIEIGTTPNSHLVNGLVDLTPNQEIIVDQSQMTSLLGIFAAGDVTNQPFKQIIISAAEGAKAILAITQYLNQTYKGE